MVLVKIAAVAVITAVITVYLKRYSPETAIFASIAGGLLILFIIADYLFGVIGSVQDFFYSTGIDGEIIKIVVKVIAVAYLVEFTASVVKDLGESSLADKVLLAGKIVVLVLALPIIKSLFGLIAEIVNV